MSGCVGVFICECGPNMRDALDMSILLKRVRELENVIFTGAFGLLCSEDGQKALIQHIQDHHLSRVVIAGCSPKEHEHTFREILRKAGLNPYLLQIANIREQCVWVTDNRDHILEKAFSLIRAAVGRVVRHRPLSMRNITVCPDVLVIGAGVAGISAALTLAQKGRKVHLVEKEPCLGGKACLYEAMFQDMACASCVLAPLLDRVLNHPNINVLTLATVVAAAGRMGNYQVKIQQNPRFVDMARCIGCNICTEACPVFVPNEFNQCMDRRLAVYLPYPGALPNVAVIDDKHCNHRETNCRACADVCAFEAINFDDGGRQLEEKVGAIVVATGFELFDPGLDQRYGYGCAKAVYSGLEFERILNSNGPTGGNLELKNGRIPEKIAFVHCVGSRSSQFYEYCSGVCCRYMIKLAQLAGEKLPGLEIYHFYTDWCLPGTVGPGDFRSNEAKGQSDRKTKYFRMAAPDAINVSESGSSLCIRFENTLGETICLDTDMVVLATAMTGGLDTDNLSKILDIQRSDDGFFCSGNPVIAPVSTTKKGIFVAGCAREPGDIPRSIADGKAAAGNILSALIPGDHLLIDPVVAAVEESKCVGCFACEKTCLLSAIKFDPESGCVKVDPLLCEGCGICACLCPSGAVGIEHFSERIISAEIRSLFVGKGL